MKVISYSLFGYGKEREANCFDFHSYLRGLMVNIRLQRLLFPSWRIRLHLDQSTYDGFKRFFELLSQKEHYNLIDIEICADAELTKAMLWRIKPIFDGKVERFICRDLDSPLTYRDAQAVKDWEDSNKIVHAITDSVSHTIAMMGGMVGFTKYANDRIKADNWDALISRSGGYSVKGADQDFLNRKIYPKFANGGESSIMQHYFLGMPNTFLDGYKTCKCYSVAGHTEDCPLNTDIGIDDEYRETNNLCGHIGAGGWYETVTNNFFSKHYDKFEDIRRVEKLHRPDIFNWNI